MRYRISEKNVFPEFSLEMEYKKLHNLFFDNREFGSLVGALGSSRTKPHLSYNDCLHVMFLDWELRGTFTSVEEMLLCLNISERDFEENTTEDRLLDYIQFITNAVCYVQEEVNKNHYYIYQAGNTIFNAITDNSLRILDKLGAKLVNIKSELFVTYKDDVADAILAENADFEVPIIEYLKIDNRGDLQRKGEVLCTLAKKLEQHEKALNGTEFKQLCSDTTFLLNNTGARHYSNPDKRSNAPFIAMTGEELEEWYDRAFQMLLACMAVVPYVGYKGDIKALKGV